MDDFDINDIILVLTKFSLFDYTSEDMFSVHRIVQEVIKDEVKQNDCVEETFENIIRMLMYSVENGEYPSTYFASSESHIATQW